MPINDRNLKPGMRLVARYHKESHTLEVLEVENNRLHYRLANGREFKSPSAAGMAITGKSCNGWAFWSVETAEAPETQQTEPSAELAAETTETEAAPAGKTGLTNKWIFRLPNQKGVPEGQARWFCHDCSQSFLVAAGEIPAFCPQGHTVV